MDETLKLTPSRRKWILLSGIFLLLALGFALMYAYTPTQNPPDDSALIVGSLVAVFLLGAILSFMMLSPDRNHLVLTPVDFRFRTVFKFRYFRWEEVEKFHPLSVKGTAMVVYSLSLQGRLHFPESMWHKLDKIFSGGEECLPDTYGMSAEALADLMNQWKKKAAG
jgi:hypothetical protein